MSKVQTTRGMNAPRCTETVDLEELLEWMTIHPEDHPDMRIVSEYKDHLKESLTMLAEEHV